MNIYSKGNNFINIPLYVGDGHAEPSYVLTASQSIMQLLIPQKTYRIKVTLPSGDIVYISGGVRWLAKNCFSTFKNGIIKKNEEVIGSIDMIRNDDLDSLIPWQFAIESGKHKIKLTVTACCEHQGKCIFTQCGKNILTLYRRHYPREFEFRCIGIIDESAIKTNDAWLYYSLIPFFYFIAERFVPQGDAALDFLNEKI